MRSLGWNWPTTQAVRRSANEGKSRRGIGLATPSSPWQKSSRHSTGSASCADCVAPRSHRVEYAPSPRLVRRAQPRSRCYAGLSPRTARPHFGVVHSSQNLRYSEGKQLPQSGRARPRPGIVAIQTLTGLRRVRLAWALRWHRPRRQNLPQLRVQCWPSTLRRAH